MKRNMLAIIILAVSIVNLAMTAFMMLTVMNTNSKTVKLIGDVAAAVNIDNTTLMPAGETAPTAVPMDKTATYDIGGDDKMTDLTDFMNLVKERCRALVLVGNAAARFKEAALKAGIDPKAIFEAGYSMERAVELAKAAAQSGDVVLLSPACASFDMYSGMAERGRNFKDIVRRMAGRK